MKSVFIIAAVLFIACRFATAEAAQLFTITQTSPVAPAQFDMGDTQSVTFTVRNSNTGGNTGERIYEMRFRLSSGTLFNSTTAAPVGWTRTAFSTTSVTFRATSWANSIINGSTLAFTLVLDLRSTTADVTESLRDARASYTTDTNFGNGITRAGNRITTNNPGSWTLKALTIDSFQITNLAGVPITSLSAGISFRLVMTITNNSTATQTSIISSPNPPTPVKTGTVTQVLTGTVYSPNPLTLAQNTTGTITFTYSTNVNDVGTISFTAYARNNTGGSTSATAVSSMLAIGKFSAALALSSTCQYEGLTITVTMTLTNGFAYNIINVTPTLTPSVGAPVVLQSGPTPAAPIGPVPGSNGIFVFTWVFLVNGGNPGDTFTFSGSATGTGQTGGNPVHTTPVTITGSIKRGGFTPTVNPTNTNAGSAIEELTWTITNQGCAAVRSVSIAIPAGWTLSAGDTYSLIGQFAPPNPGATSIENVWLPVGANPIVFSSPASPPDYTLPVAIPVKQGDFSLVFSNTPANAGANTFTLRITDVNGTFVDRNTVVTVDPFSTGTKNDALPNIWREMVN